MGIKGAKAFGLLSNSKWVIVVETRKRGYGVSLYSERGTTQTMVKVPKSQLSVKGERVCTLTDNGEVGLEAAIL